MGQNVTVDVVNLDVLTRHRRASHPHRQPPPCLFKILPPRSRKIANRQSRVQKVRICWHYSPFNFTMGIPFAHGSQKKRIVAALWRLSPFNLVTTPDKYPLLNMQDLSNGLHGCTVFTKIDLVKRYHQIPVATEDIPKTAIITPFGLFEYLYVPQAYILHLLESCRFSKRICFPGRFRIQRDSM